VIELTTYRKPARVFGPYLARRFVFLLASNKTFQDSAAPYPTMLPPSFSFVLHLLFPTSAFAIPSPATDIDPDEAISFSLTGDELFIIPYIILSEDFSNSSNIAVICFNSQPSPARHIYQSVDLSACVSIFPSVLLKRTSWIM